MHGSCRDVMSTTMMLQTFMVTVSLITGKWVFTSPVWRVLGEKTRPRLRTCDTGIWRVRNWFIIIIIITSRNVDQADELCVRRRSRSWDYWFTWSFSNECARGLSDLWIRLNSCLNLYCYVGGTFGSSVVCWADNMKFLYRRIHNFTV